MIVLMGGIQIAGYWNTGTFDGVVPEVTINTTDAEQRRRRYAAATR